MSETTRVVVLKAPGVAEEQRVPIPSLAPGEILVRVTCCTICESDRRRFRGDRESACPCILGHETVGEVVDLAGEPKTWSGDPVRVGDRVTWAVVASCRECYFCEHGLPQKCRKALRYGRDTWDGVHPRGGFAEHCLLAPGTSVFPLPDDLSDELGAAAACPAATALRAINAAKVLPNERVLVLGLGMLGRLAALIGIDRDARVTAVDPSTDRREHRVLPGAGIVDPLGQSTELASFARALEGGGFDVVLEMSGSPDAHDMAADLVRIGGRIVLVGAVASSAGRPFAPETIVRGVLTVFGVHTYRPQDLAQALETVARHAGRLNVAFGEPVSLSDVPVALGRSTESLRVPVRP